MTEAIALFVYSIAALGLVYIVGFSRISVGLRTLIWKAGLIGRWFVALVECPGCFGFWLGGAAVWFHADPLHLQRDAWHMIYFALYTSGICLYLGLRSGLISMGKTHVES